MRYMVFEKDVSALRRLAILFDLDGTLTDSAEGIINCVLPALAHFGLDAPDRETLRCFVGPPLRESFPRFGVPAEQVEEAVRIFRDRYHTVGKFENRPYDGMEPLLARLRSRGAKLFVATSKPESTAREILAHFHLAHYFDRICGASMDGVRDSKERVIAYLLEKLPGGLHPVMVGDTAFDVTGAAAHGIPTIGVSWGYGGREALLAAGAAAVADTPEALYGLLSRLP